MRQLRAGHKYFKRLLERLVYKPLTTEPYGDYSGVQDEVFVLGQDTVNEILENNPEFTAVLPSSERGYDLSDPYDCFEYLAGFVSAIARFAAFDGGQWLIFVGETDSAIRDEPEDPPEDPPES